MDSYSMVLMKVMSTAPLKQDMENLKQLTVGRWGNVVGEWVENEWNTTYQTTLFDPGELLISLHYSGESLGTFFGACNIGSPGAYSKECLLDAGEFLVIGSVKKGNPLILQKDALFNWAALQIPGDPDRLADMALDMYKTLGLIEEGY
jgi:hypothetical protein